MGLERTCHPMTDSAHQSAADQSRGGGLRVSAIMPVFNGLGFIEHSLPPLLAMQSRGEILEVIVVDDGSTDNSVAVARDHGARVIDSGGRLGPGGARNRAAEVAAGDILWFVDADVVVREDAARNLCRGFSGEDVVAVFGSYDDRPPAQNFFSQYKNLVHHHYHQRASDEAVTFWAGCGAVAKDVFLAAGGFDLESYPYPSIEDIELGNRLVNRGGRIRLLRDLQCTHLKVWRLGNLLHTEVFRRAIPWSRLILAQGGIPNDLNTGVAERLRAVLAGLLLLSPVAAAAGLVSFWVVPVLLLVTIWMNREVAALFLRRRGLLFACGALLYHQVYYVYSAAAFGWVFLETRLRRLFGGSSPSPGSG